jgi:cyclohexadienyl dehydratase
MKLNRLTSLLLTLSLSLWMVGCGVSYRAATESKTPTVDKIQQRGTLLVGTTGDYRPLSYKEPGTGEYWGFDLDVAGEIARIMNVSITYVPTSWPTLSTDVQNPALFDLAIGGITVTDARKETMDMSEGYLDNGKTIICRKEDATRFTCQEDLNHPEVRVIVNPGGLNEKFARENLPHCTLIVFDRNEEIPDQVAEGKADVMITEITEAPWYVRNNGRLAAPLLDKPFTHSKIGILMRKGQEDLLELVNATLREMKADGSLKALREKYGLQQNTIMDARELLEGLKGREVVLFVADQDELSPSEVPFPVVFTGMGKMRMFNALVTWYENRTDKSKPVILNIGSAGSAKYPIGTIVNCTHYINGGSELVYDCIDTPGDGCSVFSGDYFMSTQTFSPEQVKELSQKYDLFDMEAYAAAQFCKMYNLEFHCLKAVSDNLDGNLKDWRAILADIRVQFTELLKSCAQ